MRILVYVACLLCINTMAGMTVKPLGECPACFEDRPLLCLNSCGHCACAACWYGQIVQKLFGHETLTCVSCEKVLTPDIIKTIEKEVKKLRKNALNPETYETLKKLDKKYKKNGPLPDLTTIYQEQLVEKDLTRQFCSTPGCTGGLKIPPHRKGKVQCNKCKKWHCFDCGLQHDDETSCTQARLKNPAKYIAELYQKFNFKRCPKCGISTEKTAGCYVIYCSKCNHEYCWKCMQPWSTHVGNDHFKCTQVPDDACSICKKKLQPSDEKFTIHEQSGAYPKHDVHTACLLEWLEVDPEEGLLFNPEKLEFEFGQRAMPGIFPCPHCALKVHIELSPNKKKLLFQNITGADFLAYNIEWTKNNPQRELSLIPKIAIDFFATPERFEQAIGKKIPNNPDAQALFRAFYNRINELWRSNKHTAIKPKEQVVALAKKWLVPSMPTIFDEQKNATFYAKNLIKYVIIAPDIVTFFKKLSKKIPLDSLVENLWLDMKASPFWPLMPLISDQQLQTITQALGGNAQQFAGFLKILKETYAEQVKQQPKPLDTNITRALEAFSGSLETLASALRAG